MNGAIKATAPLKTCAILQPSYIPWRGYFHQIQKADVFVFYDDVQYVRHSWRNRNRVKTPNGVRWLTIPVHSTDRTSRLKIQDVPIASGRRWERAHLETLRQSYSKAPYFDRYLPMLENWYSTGFTRLADFVIRTTVELAREVGLTRTEFVRSSALRGAGMKTDHVLSLIRQVGASHLVNGPTARAYLDTELLGENGITVEWMEYDYPEYDQLYPPFDPHVSILDLLMMQGSSAGDYIWGCAR